MFDGLLDSGIADVCKDVTQFLVVNNIWDWTKEISQAIIVAVFAISCVRWTWTKTLGRPASVYKFILGELKRQDILWADKENRVQTNRMDLVYSTYNGDPDGLRGVKLGSNDVTDLLTKRQRKKLTAIVARERNRHLIAHNKLRTKQILEIMQQRSSPA